jgi:hypothetical protein
MSRILLGLLVCGKKGIIWAVWCEFVTNTQELESYLKVSLQNKAIHSCLKSIM